MPTLETIQINALDLEQEYVQLVDYSYEITKSLKAITEVTYAYIDNNHSAFSEEQINDLRKIYNLLAEGYQLYEEMVAVGDYSAYYKVVKVRDSIFELNAKLTKRQIKRAKNSESSTRSSILFLNLINELKIVALQSSNLMKSQRDFDEQYAKSVPELDAHGLIKSVTRKL